jgi:6-phospho-3-hexuloisomerase
MTGAGTVASDIAAEVQAAISATRHDGILALTEVLLGSHRVFVAGAGRSGLMARAFAMRLMHLGLPAHTVGETATPALERGDTLVVASGSGETTTLVPIVERAGMLGAFVATVTAAPAGSIARMADLVIEVPPAGPRSVQPLGSLYEQCVLLIFDSVVLELMRLTGTSADVMRARHANLE